jgi:hypothetical protein
MPSVSTLHATESPSAIRHAPARRGCPPCILQDGELQDATPRLSSAEFPRCDRRHASCYWSSVDLLYLGLAGAFFVVTWALIAACERLS